MRLPGVGDKEDIKVLKKSSVTELHRQRVMQVRRSQQGASG